LTENINDITKKCTNCGNVIKISPEDLIITCSYCGETYDVDFKKVPGHMMIPSKTTDEIKKNVNNFLSKNHTNADEVSITEVKANYLPYWIVPFSSFTHFYGVQQSSVTRYRTKTRTVRDAQGKTRTETYQEAYSVTVWAPKEGNFNRAGKENVIARKHTAFYGFNEFQDTLVLDNAVPFDFEKIKGSASEFINAEVNPHESQMDAYGRIEDKNRAIAGSGLTKLVRCDSQITTENPLYVHAPLWQVRYKYDDKLYKVSAAGDSGKVVKGEVPLTMKRRLINYIIGMVVMVVSGIVGNVGVSVFNTSTDDTGSFIGMLLAIASFVGVILSFIPLRLAFKVQLEKSAIKEINKDRSKALKANQKALAAGVNTAAAEEGIEIQEVEPTDVEVTDNTTGGLDDSNPTFDESNQGNTDNSNTDDSDEGNADTSNVDNDDQNTEGGN
jgi:hypothetical protein